MLVLLGKKYTKLLTFQFSFNLDSEACLKTKVFSFLMFLFDFLHSHCQSFCFLVFLFLIIFVPLSYPVANFPGLISYFPPMCTSLIY